MSELTVKYEAMVASGKIQHDGRQRELVNYLEILRTQLIKKQSHFWRWLSTKKDIRGVYFWGNVGTGKTFLMDLFFDSLSIKQKTRLHFHQFMRRVQSSLTELQGHESPLEIIAKEWASKTTVLCFDEFYVTDIADAMILERLFDALFKEGVVLVATSNIAPDNLYADGLHRKRFLPAIALIKKHCQVMQLDSGKDYRRDFFEKQGVYFYPNNHTNKQKLADWFAILARGNVVDNTTLTIQDRSVDTIKASDNAVWFDFYKLCAPPRSYTDYLSLMEQFNTIIVSGVPVIAEHDIASVTYLIHLIDVLYDARARLIIMAEDKPDNLYVGGKKLFEFQRCLSRLEEMRSKEYAEHIKTSCDP